MLDVEPVVQRPTQVTGELPPTYGASPAPAECRDAPPHEGATGSRVIDACGKWGGRGLAPDIRELLEQALEKHR